MFIVVVLGDRSIIVSVECISLVIDVIIGMFKVMLKVFNEVNKFKVGMFIDVLFEYVIYVNVMLLFCRVLVIIDNNYSVFVVDNGKVKKVDIFIGFENNEVVEVINGLNGNEEVVIVGY